MDFSIVLFDDIASRDHLLPLVATRPISDLRVGALTIGQKWQLISKQDVSYLTVDYLQSKFPLDPLQSTILLIHGSLLPSQELINILLHEDFYSNVINEQAELIAVKIHKKDLSTYACKCKTRLDDGHHVSGLKRVIYPEDIFKFNAAEISIDIASLKLTKANKGFWKNVLFFGDDVYIDESVVIDQAVIDSRLGPVMIAKDVIIESGVTIKGPVSINQGSRVKTGAVLYTNVTVGPNCTINGEINNVVIWGNSAKGHEGYLGCAVVGQGCNLGGGTTNSNLKNDWTNVKLYDYCDEEYRDTAILKCGVIIGDQVMLGINTKITTGTVIGVGAQVAMSKFIPKFVPDFSWITDDKMEPYVLEKFIQMVQRKAKVKSEKITEEDLLVFKNIYNNTQKLRSYNQH